VPLDELHLSGLDLTEEDLTTLTPRLPCFMFIRLLDLSNNIVTSHMVKMAAHFSSLKYLEQLNMSRSCLTNASVVAICKALGSSASLKRTLRSINFSHNQISDRRVIRSLLVTIASITGLKQLDLSGNVIGDELGCVLMRSLTAHRSLEVLRLNLTEIGCCSLSALKCCLSDLPVLHTVACASNSFESGLLTMFTAFKPEGESQELTQESRGFRGLKQLDLSGLNTNNCNVMTSQEINDTVLSLPHQQVIEEITMIHTSVLNQSDLVSLLVACENHKSLKKLRLSEASIPTLANKSCWTCLQLM